MRDKIENYTKYDGTPFLHEIEEKGKIIATEMEIGVKMGPFKDFRNNVKPN